MKKMMTVLFIAGMLFAFTAQAAVKVQDLRTAADKPTLVEDEFVVTFDSGMEDKVTKKIMKAYKIKKAKKSYKAGSFVVFKVDKSEKKVARIIDELKGEAGIATIEQNGYAYATGNPNDSYFSYQWHYKPGTGIDMGTAWGTTGFNAGNGVKVAVVDTGVRESLSDLSGVNFANGWDFINNDNNADDDAGHGSHVCGTIAQTTNNSHGCAGMAGGVTIIPVKSLNSAGSGSWTQVADGIEWACDQGADIINLSLGGYGGATVLRNAVNYAHNNGCLVICAKGNDNTGSSHYPSDYTNAFAVAATSSAGTRASYSNYNSATDIAAPGGDTADRDGNGYIDGVLQQTINGWYFYYGTSMATPHVAGLAALLLQKNPGWDNNDLRAVIQKTAVDLGSAGKDNYYGCGLIDPNAALAETNTSVACW